MSASRLVPIAEVARPHGVQGELRLKVYNPETTLLGRGARVVLRLSTGQEAEHRITACRAMPGALLVRLESVGSRDAAEALRGASVLVRRSAFPPAEEGEFYACDVEGARAELVSGEAVGTVRQLASYPTCQVLVIDTVDGKQLEIPLTADFVVDIDPEGGIVRLSSRDGLG